LATIKWFKHNNKTLNNGTNVFELFSDGKATTVTNIIATKTIAERYEFILICCIYP